MVTNPYEIRLKIIRSDLTWAADQGIITSVQAGSLWDALTKKYEHQPRFTFGHVIYYLGALIIISSMSDLEIDSVANPPKNTDHKRKLF
jgi:hypothetical protein